MVPSPYNPRGRLAAQPSGGRGGANDPPVPQCGGSSAQSGCQLSRASRGGAVSPAGPAAASHIHRMFVLLPQRSRQGLAAYIPRDCGQAGAGPLSAVGARGRCTHASTPYGALEIRNPLKYFHIRPKIYALGVYFRAPAGSAATAGSAAGRAGTGSTPTCPPTQQPPAPPQLTKANHWVCN